MTFVVIVRPDTEVKVIYSVNICHKNSDFIGTLTHPLSCTNNEFNNLAHASVEVMRENQ